MPELGLSTHQGHLRLALSGRLDAYSISALWNEARTALARNAGLPALIDGSRIEYCDTAGAAMLLDLAHGARRAPVELVNLPAQARQLLAQLDAAALAAPRPEPAPPFVERVGLGAASIARGLQELVAFVGESSAALAVALFRPSRLRWNDALRTARAAGVDALPIVSLIAFLMGVILAFQAGTAMRRFGAEIFVADLVGLALLRELGPLMTAILLAGRSGAAFAAELGTMKVNEEIDALSTMGFEPVRFLVVPRLVAALLVTPVLSVYADLIGLVGGALVMLSFDISSATYYHEVVRAVGLSDLFTGLGKSLAFGLLVSGVGCLRGLQTRAGAAAVGLSATSAVVSAIVLIVAADGVFAVIFYYLNV